MVRFLEQVRLAFFCCRCTFKPYVCIYVESMTSTTCMMQVACECNSFEGILVVAQLHQEDVKEGYDAHLLQPYIFFIFSSYVPTCFRVMYLCLYWKES
jgi:hypothetical protein